MPILNTSIFISSPMAAPLLFSRSRTKAVSKDSLSLCTVLLYFFASSLGGLPLRKKSSVQFALRMFLSKGPSYSSKKAMYPGKKKFFFL
jgi:hypothetical protein